MATQAQFEEKARQDRRGVQNPALNDLATPAQLAEKNRQNGVQSFATPAQLAEKNRQNGAADFATPAQLAEKRGRPRDQLHTIEPPSSSYTFGAPPPPPYNADDAKRSALISEQWRSRDPRSSSTHSLVPSESTREGRRTLLLIFIHGFMGNETSFQSFPAHVHNLLTIQLAETHVVHTKIYPRYKSRKAIEFARDDFSDWLQPHENERTEVVLLGHSMGGLLAAEVALQKPFTTASGQPFRHRLLGTINFDTPFLGMHPGVVVSGLGSLFRPAPDPPGRHPPASDLESAGSSTYTASISDASSQRTNYTSPLASPPANDPFFNPAFPNDVRLPDRKGWSSVLHFVNKHSDGLTSATKQYVMSHIEFGGCMADYPGLKNRYEKIRSLEDVDDITRKPGPGYHPPARRIRFVNYYTASTGRPKAPKRPKTPEIPPGHLLDSNGIAQPIEVEMNDMTLDPPRHSRSRSATPTPRISVEVHHEGNVIPQKLDDAPEAPPLSPVGPVQTDIQNMGQASGVQNDVQESLPPMQHIDSIPIEDDHNDLYSAPTNTSGKAEPTSEQEAADLQHIISDPGLPPIPPMPREPEPFNPDGHYDKDARKLAEKEHKRVMKAYQQAIKDRESAIKDRKKFVEKREKKARQEKEKQLKSDEKQRMKEEKEEEKRNVTINPEPRDARRDSTSTSATQSSKPKRDKKFCMLPPETGGKRDKTWIRVYMEGVDEVGAHCGLFFPGPQYESLVNDVGERIAVWIGEDATRRAIEEVERGY